MAFQSIRKFVSVQKGRKRTDAMLSLNIILNGMLKNGDASYSVSILVHPDLIAQMNWDDKTRLDVLVDSENNACMLKKDSAGFSLSFPRKNNDGGYAGISANVKFKVPEPFDYIPKDSDRIELTILDCSDDHVVFEMPKIPVADSESKSEPKHELPQTERQVRMNNNRVDRPFQLQAV